MYKPLTVLKKIDKVIIDKYFGFSFFEIDDYTSHNFKSLKFFLFKNDLENVTLKINQKNLYNLELQRKNKLEGLSEKIEKFSRASLNYNQSDFNIKLRVKGDRSLHWYDIEEKKSEDILNKIKKIWDENLEISKYSKTGAYE